MQDLTAEIFVAAGCSTEESARIGQRLVMANLTGHDSHGSGILSVNGLWLEPRLQFTRRRQEKLAAELDRLRRFICADQVVFENGFLRSEN